LTSPHLQLRDALRSRKQQRLFQQRVAVALQQLVRCCFGAAEVLEALTNGSSPTADPSWMVSFMENPKRKMDVFSRGTFILGNLHF